MLAHAVTLILAGFAGIGLGSIAAMLILSGGDASFENRLAASVVVLYFVAMTWGIVELLGRCL